MVAGTTIAFDASSLVLGSSPPAEALSCHDNWMGAGPSAGWDSAANWSAGVPNSTSVDVCISSGAAVTLPDGSFSVGELTVSAGSSLAIGTMASLSVTSGLQNDGALTVGAIGAPATSTTTATPETTATAQTTATSATTGSPVTSATSATPDHAGLTLDGPITNAGTLTVDGAVAVGDTTSTKLTNDGTIGVAPSGLIDMDRSSTIANEPDGLLAFGIDGPPSVVADYGRITNGTLSLAGSADPVFENGFTPSPGAEYVVDSGASSGTFTSVLGGATADYSHAGQVGLTGGAPATDTSTSITSSLAAGSSDGQVVQFTAKVIATSGTNPTGSVSFDAGDLLVGRSPVTTDAAGVSTAALDLSSLPVGSDSVTATYGGDVLFGASTSPVLTQVVDPNPTNVTISASSASPEPGQPVTDTATVSLPAPGTGTPTGTVSFTDDGSPVTGCQSLGLPAVTPLQVSCTEIYGSSAMHSIVASYSGDADDAPSNASLLQAVGQIPTQTTVTSSSPTSTYGQSVTLTATVTPTPSASDTPSGTVTFYDYETTPIATVGVSPAAGTATASIDISSLTGGLHSITATYNGDTNLSASSSGAPVDLDVAEAATTVTVASSADPTLVGQAVVFTATISSSVPGETGSVQFVDNGFMIGSGSVSGGQATFQTGSLTLGAHPITAVYEGDDDFVGTSSTNTINQTVVTAPLPPGSTTTSLAMSSAEPNYGESVTMTAIVTPTAGTATPTGMVTFADNGVTLGSSVLSTSEGVTSTSMLLTTLAVGPHSITASYGAGTGLLPSSSVAVPVTVSRALTTLSLGSSNNPYIFGEPVTLTANVFPTTGSGETGTVTFFDNGISIGTGSVSYGQATLTTTFVQVGTNRITAAYSGDGDFVGSATDGAFSEVPGT